MKQRLLLMIIFMLFILSGCLPQFEDGTLKFKEYRESQYNIQANPELCDPCNQCRLQALLFKYLYYNEHLDECNDVYGWPRDYDDPVDPDRAKSGLKSNCKLHFSGNQISDYASARWGFLEIFNYYCYQEYEFCCPENGAWR